MGASKSKDNSSIIFQICKDGVTYIEDLYRLSPRQSWKYYVPACSADNLYYLMLDSDEKATLEIIVNEKYVIIEYIYRDVREMIVWYPAFHTYETLTCQCNSILSYFRQCPTVHRAD